MELRKRQDRIWIENSSGVEIAFVSFPWERENTVRIASTVVDSSLRGQGVAGILLESLAEELRATGQKAIPVCPMRQNGLRSIQNSRICWNRPIDRNEQTEEALSQDGASFSIFCMAVL